MAVSAYIQSAISQLHSALDHMHQEMDGLRHQTDQEKHQLQQDIHGLEQSLRVDEVGLHTATDDAKPLLSASATTTTRLRAKRLGCLLSTANCSMLCNQRRRYITLCRI